MNNLFVPTEEQLAVVQHEGSAFVTACPGAGKTRVMVQRARQLHIDMPPWYGAAFLSFTQAAVSELEARVIEERFLEPPFFPSFVGTFDSFLWQFIVAPFGIEGFDGAPRCIPDIGDIQVRLNEGSHPLTLSCFCLRTGTILEDEAKKRGFDVTRVPLSRVRAYETRARKIRTSLRRRGLLGFDDARIVAVKHINDGSIAGRLASALRSRFEEVIVDEAQDCNPEDLELISWLRNSGIVVKVVCDPNQAIYGFRGGVTAHLFEFESEFKEDERLRLTGNFRSTENICRVIAQFRAPDVRGNPDAALGESGRESLPVYIVCYGGRGVSKDIGREFCDLLELLKIDPRRCPIVASTSATAAGAAGQPRRSGTQERSVRLAECVAGFQASSGFGEMKGTLEETHRILLELEGKLDSGSYHRYVVDNEIEPGSWRPTVINVLQTLRFDDCKYPDGRSWLAAAKAFLAKEVSLAAGKTVGQMLRWKEALDGAVSVADSISAVPRTIHSVKGTEYPAVCVVTTTTLNRILDFLETGEPSDRAEDARKLYVAMSRAQKALVIAAPKSQAERLKSHLEAGGAAVATRNV